MDIHRSKSRIATLWVIREYQPISIRQIFQRFRTGDTEIPEFIRKNCLTCRFIRELRRDVAEFIEAHLVVTQREEILTVDSMLETTKTLASVQDMFFVSLTGLIKRPADFIEAYPIFGRVADKADIWGQIFVAMPFRDDLRPIYDDHILKVSSELNLSCKRGDNFFTTNSIMHDVWSAIYHSQLCIVDCTGRNPNVFYELGIAHTIGRKSILIAQNIEDIPFDIRHLRTIIYEYTPRGVNEFEETLKKTIQQELGLE
jgi:hypothetical protein